MAVSRQDRDPRQVLHNLLQRDALFTDRLAEQTRQLSPQGAQGGGRGHRGRPRTAIL
ncbi:hypothetical protein [Nonomuraea turkmeniaca]|uniref:hypothetical protein n=1 Tax=Nonomuraea turkmeniaca TaxID=103838 RepID=UPI0014770F76|nr:hypothetical protein [Nonomuraea turkmeniaca]